MLIDGQPLRDMSNRELRKAVKRAARTIDELPASGNSREERAQALERGEEAAHVLKNAAAVLRNRENVEKYATIAARAAAEASIAVQRARAEASEQARLERRRELDERAAKERQKKREENIAKGRVYVPKGTWQTDALRIFASRELFPRPSRRRDALDGCMSRRRSSRPSPI